MPSRAIAVLLLLPLAGLAQADDAATASATTAATAATPPTTPAAPATTAAAAAPVTGETLQEVTVSATLLRDQPLQDVPASITVLDAATLAAAGEQHFEDVIGLVPNLNWAGDTNRPRYFQIRGIGDLDQYTGAPNPSIGFMVDDIDFSDIGTIGTLFDVDQIEVLRGPQGARYGANALGGLIAIQSAAPESTFGGRVEVSAGDYDTQSYGAVVTGPVAALDSSFRLAVQKYTSDGFYDNAYLNRDDTDGEDELTVRGRWRFQPSDALRVDLTLMDIRIDDGYDAWNFDGSRTTQTDQPGEDDQNSTAAAVHLEYSDLGPATLTLIGTVADSRIRYGYDSDFGNLALWAPYVYQYSDDQARDRRTNSVEARLANTTAGALNWLFGVYALDLSEDFADRAPGIYLDPDDPSADSQSLSVTNSHFYSRNAAVYSELDGPIAKRWHWSAGVRAERRTADYHDLTNDLDAPDPLTHAFAPVNHMWGGNTSLEYHLDKDQNLYVQLGRGYKAGGFNLGPGLPANQILFNPESDVDFETGYKSDLLDHRLRLDADVFYTHRTGLQLQTGEQLVPSDPTTFVLYNVNVPSGRNYGAESTLDWLVNDVVELGASAGALNSSYHGLTLDGLPLPDRQLPNAPSWQTSLSVTLHASHGLFLRADTTGRGSFYYDEPALDPYASHSYVLLNLKGGIRRDDWSAELWVRNVTDRNYAVRGFYFGDVPPNFPNQQFTQLGEPRQVGCTLTYSFH